MQLEFRELTHFGHAPPLTDIQADFEINRSTRYQITGKKIIDTDGQTDGRTDGTTDGQTDRRRARQQ